MSPIVDAAETAEAPRYLTLADSNVAAEVF